MKQSESADPDRAVTGKAEPLTKERLDEIRETATDAIRPCPHCDDGIEDRECICMRETPGYGEMARLLLEVTGEVERLSENVMTLQILSADVADVIVERDNGYRRCLACDHQWHMDDDPRHDDECVLLRLEAEVTIQRTGKDHMRAARKSRRQP